MGFRTSKFMTGMKSKKALKTLSVAALAGIASMGATNSAVAQDSPITPALGDNASYTLTPVEQSTDNLITLYKYDNTGITEAVNYEINLKQTTYGSGDEAKYFKWTTDETTGLHAFNETTINNALITGKYSASGSNDYVGKIITTQFSDTYGGAIYNEGDMGDISSNFIGNSATGASRHSWGGAIYNEQVDVWTMSTIGDITGDFVGNHVDGGETANGGAIYNKVSIIGNITGDFIGNYGIRSTYYPDVFTDLTNSSGAHGGAIYNIAQSMQDYSEIGDITGDFIGNFIASGDLGDASGGAISNEAWSGSVYIGNITGDFIGNRALGHVGAIGGAIHNNGKIGNINSNFIGNYARGHYAHGGAIAMYNDSYYGGAIIGDITGNFIGNHVWGNSWAHGGAIYNEKGVLGEITGDFIGNYAFSNSSALGGAIYNYADFPEVEGALQCMQLLVLNDDGTIYEELFAIMSSEGSILNLSEDELQQLIDNGTITSFPLVYGGSVLKSELETEANSKGMTIDDYLAMMKQEGIMTTNPNDLLDVKVTISKLSVDSVRAFNTNLVLKNSNILNNYVKSQNTAFGGAIASVAGTLKISADNGKVYLISGNYAQSGDSIDDNAIYMNGGNLIFDVTNGSTIQLDDNINGQNYETFIIGDNASKFILNNKIKNSTTHLVDTNLYLTKDSHLDGNNLGLHSGMLNMINNQAGVSALNSLTVTGDTNVLVDVDLKNQTMDRFTATEYGTHSGKLNVIGMNLLSDATTDKTEILFAEQGLKDNVTYGGGELPHSNYQTEVYTPIYKYNVAYDNKDDAGYFVFSRGGKVGGADSFNPAILGSSTSATVGAVGTINQTFNYAFSNADTIMNIPYLERISMRDKNKYALSITGDATDMGRFSPLYQPSDEEASVWVKPYAAFETVGLKNGPKVHNNTYGTLIGFDTEMQQLRRGWDRVWTGYIGYNGASQRYSGIDSTQNGGLIGGTMTLYKGNFFNATTVSVGANVANNQTMYGSEDFAMLLSGIGNKTGYNIEFKEGKLILQPSMLMSYTFVNTFDYTNAAGVRIDNKPLHALQLAPGVKVIGNLKNGWQPYASVQMVWNLMGESNATADGVKLPEMSIKPYVQYGVGVQKRIKDHFMAYGQAMIQNGGRTGVSLTAGFRWALGHDNCKYEKTQRHNGVKTEGSITSKEILRSAQNDRGKCIRHSELDSESINANKTLSQGEGATGKKILKQMTPQQKAEYGGGKYMNTSRTAISGSLRQY